jgi:predicted nucleotide-binding protein (sugar kinase/HSP70/actin superfamily)
VDEARTLKTLARAGKDAIEAMESVETSGRQPLKVVMVGETYTVLEPSINMDIERRLGYMGVIVERSSYFSTHIRKGLQVDRKIRRERRRLIESAKPYLNFDVGAECNFSVAEAIQAVKQGFDGVVHVYPFSCMPETNAATVLSAVGTDLGIPILPLALDRQDMGLRIDTQLEAYVDVMRWRREGKLQ